MNKNIFRVAIAALFFVSCATERNFQKYAAKHPVKLAELCIEKFPIKDSVGEAVIDSTHKADNKDHTADIDTIGKIADELVDKINSAGFHPTDREKKECLDVIAAYTKENAELKAKAKALQSDVKRLQANYKPCVSDTVFSTKSHFLENPAKDVVIGSQRTQLAKTEQQRDDAKGKAKTYFWIIVALLAVIGAGIFGKIKGII